MTETTSEDAAVDATIIMTPAQRLDMHDTAVLSSSSFQEEEEDVDPNFKVLISALENKLDAKLCNELECLESKLENQLKLFIQTIVQVELSKKDYSCYYGRSNNCNGVVTTTQKNDKYNNEEDVKFFDFTLESEEDEEDEEENKPNQREAYVEPEIDIQIAGQVLPQRLTYVPPSKKPNAPVVADVRQQLRPSASSRRRRLMNRSNTLIRMFSPNNDEIAGKDDDDKDNLSSLYPDSYNFIATSNFGSMPSNCGLIIFCAQIASCVLLCQDLFRYGMPKNITTGVRVTQLFAIIFATLTQDDVRASIEQFYEGYNRNLVGSKFPQSSHRKWSLAVFCRLLEGIMVLFASFVLIIQSDNIRDLLMNFTAVTFISALDDVAFSLSADGYFGSELLRKAIHIQDTKYSVRSSWSESKIFVNRGLLFTVFAAMAVAWAVISYDQMSSHNLCQQLYVEFADDEMLSTANGVYDINPSKYNNDRVSYLERRSSSPTNNQQQGKIAYCKSEKSWTFSIGVDSDPCDWKAKSSSLNSGGGTFDIMETQSSQWFTTVGIGININRPMQSFRLSCLDSWNNCGSSGVNINNECCIGEECNCPPNTYGLSCLDSNPCPILKMLNDHTDHMFHILEDTNKTASVQSYNHPVYAKLKENHGELMMLAGSHWIITTTQSFPAFIHEIRHNNHTTTSISASFATYLVKNGFHASTLPPNSISYISQTVDALSSLTPLGLQWFYPFYFSYNQSGLPMADLSRPALSVQLSCAYCNNITNPCQFDGICDSGSENAAGGECICKHGTTGTFCEITPIGNGICNPYFNTPEYNYDGGDCCAATCGRSNRNSNSPEITNMQQHLCGKNALKAPFDVDYDDGPSLRGDGYPHCIDPTMVPISVDVDGKVRASTFHIKFVCEGITYLEIPPNIMPDNFHGIETIMVKHGTQCDFSITSKKILQSQGTKEIYIDYIISFIQQDDDGDNVGTVTTTIGAAATTGNSSSSSNSQSSLLLLSEAKFKFDLGVAKREVGSFIVLKDCLRYNEDDDNAFSAKIKAQNLIQYVKTDLGGSMAYYKQEYKIADSSTPQGQALAWLNNDGSVWGSCNRHDLKQRYYLALLLLTVNHNVFNDDSKMQLQNVHECNWDNGVSLQCNSNLEFIAIDFGNLVLNGSIPFEIGQFNKLEKINMETNNLKGTIPSSLGNLDHLKYLNLGDNQLTGSIPSEIGKLSELEILKLASNKFNSTIPSDIGQLTKLETINFKVNELSGSLPAELGLLTNLKSLVLSYNNFESNLPPGLGNLTILEDLQLQLNHFTGVIPEQLSNLRHLKNLRCNNNDLSGMLSSFLGSNTNLESVDLGTNFLSGSIPTEIGRIKNLTFLSFMGNKLSGSIPSETGQLIKLERLLLDRNSFSGSLPSELGNMTKLVRIEIMDNMLSGTIPTNIGHLRNLEALWLSRNSLSGPIPTHIGGMTNLEILYIQENRLTGTLVSEAGNLANLKDIRLDWNILTGPIPTEYGRLKELSILTLRSNRLSGSIFTEIGELSNLVSLYLSDNWLNGSIPSQVGKLSELSQLFFDRNELNSGIPTEIGFCTNLGALLFYRNQLGSNIPTEIGKLTDLWFLYAHDNNLVGGIPGEIGFATNLVELSLYNNFLSGIPTEVGKLTNLVYLDLDKNLLIGPIPSELGNLNNLEILYLSHNSLNGTIPTQIGAMTNLVRLYLPSNELSGTIPTELGTLPKLEYLNLHNTTLDGAIPSNVCSLQSLNRLIIDCEDITCTQDCNCRGMEYNGGDSLLYSCPPPKPQDNDCMDGFMKLSIIFVADNGPAEIQWDVRVKETTLLKSMNTSDTSSVNYQSVCIPTKSCTLFTIYDNGGDGICCDKGFGSYTLFLDNEIFIYGGEFASVESVPIGLCE